MPYRDFDYTKFRRFLATAEVRTLDIAREAAQAFADEAERVMRETFIAAETPTGQARVARGGNGPGRVDTARLIDAIASELKESGAEVVARAGFLEDKASYFLIQDQSARYGAHALEAGFIAGREAAIAVIIRRWGS